MSRGSGGEAASGTDDLAAIDQAIAALEAQRTAWGDSIVDTALGPLRERRAVLTAEREGRRALATVLFADLVDSTELARRLDPEDMGELLDAIFTSWRTEIEGRGGVVEKFIGDAVMAVFGLHRAQEDDPHQAIRAGLAMTAHLDEVGRHLIRGDGITLAARVGIDSGEVLVTQVDHRPGQDEVVVGGTVNRASRLQSAAPPGGVVISADTHRLVRGAFGFRATEPLRLKGFSDPVEGFLVLSERPGGFELDEGRGIEGVHTRTIGRNLELERLRHHFDDVEDERIWRVVTVVGDAGIGKSRLLAEFDRWLAEKPGPVWWFRGRASPAEQNLPYGLLRQLMATRFRIRETDPPESVRRAWEQGWEAAFGPGEDTRDRAALVGSWLGFELGEQRLPGRDPEAEALRASTQLGEYFARLALTSLVVVLLEDMHWADEASLAWIDEAATGQRAGPVLVVGTARPTLLERLPSWGEGLEHHARLALEPLSKRHSRDLLAEVLQRVDSIPETLRDLVVEAAEGNPFYLEELVSWLLDTGVIISDGDKWSVRERVIERTEVPPTLRAVLQARLDALSPQERRVLQRASVIGRVFWETAVEAIERDLGDATPPEVAEALDRLRTRDLVHKRGQASFAGTREFVFKHALLRDVAYDSLLKAQRADYHRRAATWMEEIAETNRRADQYAGLIAQHHELGGDTRAAARWYRRAGANAASVYALTEATALLDKGLALAPESEPELRFDLLMLRQRVFDRLGDRARQGADLDAMEKLVTGLDPARKVDRMLAEANRAYRVSDYATQAVLAAEAVEAARGSGVSSAEAELLLGKALVWSGDYQQARLSSSRRWSRRCGSGPPGRSPRRIGPWPTWPTAVGSTPTR